MRNPVTSVAVLGSPSMGDELCESVARSLLSDLNQAYPLRSVFTVKEDCLGKAIRVQSKRYGWKRLGSSLDQPYHDKEAMAVAGLVWRTQRVVVYWDGATKGMVPELIQMCTRLNKPFKIFEV